ncbi:MAG TPA: hypothetical protein VJG85_01440 [Patescibacteria group bacterium]|nr:hypothetical protein [Patescibacteria group bacterium]
MADNDARIAQMRETLWANVQRLQEERRKAFEAHQKRIEQHPPRFGCDYGCAEAAAIAGQIEQVILTGKELGLVDQSVDPMDYY